MTKEDKELLLRDLCARLPYGVKGIITYNGDKDIFTIKGIYNDILSLSDSECCHLEDFRPYFFPFSSMTEEQKESSPFELSLLNVFINGHISLFEDEELNIDDLNRLYDWLNKSHFDYRGLIEKSLALDATGLNIY